MPDRRYLGQRISFDGHLCTVRYIGPVKNTKKGDWLGVEWDDPSRGKHDGSHEGERYFQCISGHPTAGSLVRPSRPSDPPLNFLDALAKKYNSSNRPKDTVAEEKIRISGKTVEEVGFDKINRQLAALQELKIVVLDGLCVAGVNDFPQEAEGTVTDSTQPSARWSFVEGLKSKNLSIVELDLSRNLLETWIDVIGICGALRFLVALELNENRFRDKNCLSPRDASHSFEGIKLLGLNATLLSWDEIVSITSNFHSLTTLSLASNGLKFLTNSLHIEGIERLDLSFNSLQSLQSIACLSQLPNLTRLSLHSNPFTLSLPPEPIHTQASHATICFRFLKELDLSSTAISDLSTMDSISTFFPTLTKLLTKQAPVTAIPSATLHTIARLPGITELNYQPITRDSRQNAEIFYIEFVAKQFASATTADEEQEIRRQNPRYKPLCAIHYEPEIIKKQPEQTDTGTLKARVTKFTFYISNLDLEKARYQLSLVPKSPSQPQPQPEPPTLTNPQEESHSQPPATIEKSYLIPLTVSTYTLLGIVGRLFNILPHSIRLILETDEWDPIAGTEDEEGWSVSEDESGDSDEGDEPDEEERKGRGDEERKGGGRRKGRDETRWKRREMDIPAGTRMVGFFVEGEQARVRVELR